MKFLLKFRIKEKRVNVKTKEEYKQELLNKQGREQFRKLIDKGLSLPIAVL